MTLRVIRNNSRQAIRDINSAENRVLGRTGAYARQVIRNSLHVEPRQRKRRSKNSRARGLTSSSNAATNSSSSRRRNRSDISKPGQRPFAHGETRSLKNMILFQVDRVTKMVKIGVTLHRNGTDLGKTLEIGGPTEIVNFQGKKKRVVIQKRPFVERGVDESTPRMQQIFYEEMGRIF